MSEDFPPPPSGPSTPSYPPPPPPRPGGGSCWKWGGIACVGCGCIGVLALLGLMAFVASKPEFRESFSRVMSSTQEAAQTVQRMQTLGQAIEKYVADNGRYPDRLQDLTPRYVEADLLRTSAEPNAKLFVYRKPPDNAPGTFRILETEVPNPVMPTQGPPIRYYWTKAGKVETPSPFEVEEEARKKRTQQTDTEDRSSPQ